MRPNVDIHGQFVCTCLTVFCLHAHYFVLSVFIMLASTEVVSIVLLLVPTKSPSAFYRLPQLSPKSLGSGRIPGLQVGVTCHYLEYPMSLEQNLLIKPNLTSKQTSIGQEGTGDKYYEKILQIKINLVVYVFGLQLQDADPKEKPRVHL